ncbi:polyprenyl synthetase family protein [Streptomyces sp. ODS28]|uniref:polyprenyl synthetase family protein n=1 Tax=Streptomyces sp. ODS28 TaxID=3136688 RepID=UPI0031E954B6
MTAPSETTNPPLADAAPQTGAPQTAAPHRPHQPDARADARPDAPEVLERCRDLVRPALAEAVRRVHPYPGEMTAYSLGWCAVGGTPEPGPRAEGKGVRQALAVLGAEAAGAPGDTGVPAAVAVELVHLFSLLHDDVMDGDEMRRQRPTAWKAYGTGPAVLAGDALFAQAVELLAETPGTQGGAAVRRLAAALGDLVRGQSDDLLFESRPWRGPEAVSPGEYRTMAENKTGALLGSAMALGAVLAGAPASVADGLDSAGRHLGIAFQAVDDLLGIWGDPAATGKPVHNDLRQAKKTYPVLSALEDGGPAAQRLGTLLGSAQPLDATAARTAAGLVEEAGGRTAALREARAQLDAARGCLAALPLERAAVQDVQALLPFLIDRSV